MAERTSKLVLPAGLVQAVKQGRVIPFLGAGASLSAVDDTDNHPPDSKALATLLSQHFLGEPAGDSDLMTIAELAIHEASSNLVFEFIRNKLKPFKPGIGHNLLATFKWHMMATTNYDTYIEDAYGHANQRVQDLVPFVKNSEPVEDRRSRVPHPLSLQKLHGCIDHAHDHEIPLVLTSAHYEQFAQNRDKLYQRLEAVANEMVFLFIGFSLTDPHIRNIVHRLDRAAGGRPKYYVVSPRISEKTKAVWAARQIEVIDATFDEFMLELDRQIPASFRAIVPSVSPNDLPIKAHFATTSDPSEKLGQALDIDLTHVHPNMTVPPHSARKFYKGYDLGFSAVASDWDVSRGAVVDLLYGAIDDLSVSGPKFHLLRGPGGSGKTIALKRAAWNIAAEFEGLVLWLNESGKLDLEVIEELQALTRNKRLFLLVDRAGHRINELSQLMSAAREKGFALTIVAAERDNEWNIYSGNFDERWLTSEYRIGTLSPAETEELIDLLGKHGALGVLEGRPRSEQIQAFEGADRQLLVALHETTLGVPFEDIVANEYDSVVPSQAKRLYLDICTLNQFGTPVRAGLIHRISGIPFSLYATNFFLPLENVVLTQRNRYSGDYEYKARHRHIAEIVFKRACQSDGDRVGQIVRIAGSLDIGFTADFEALEALARARTLNTYLRQVESGRKVYEELVQIAATAGFVWQQRAIYETIAEGGSFEVAEQYGQKALELDQRNRSIWHTLIEISRKRSKAATNASQRDYYLAQARTRLRKVSSDNSSYMAATRCKIALDELEIARDNLTEDWAEAATKHYIDTIRETEDVIHKAVATHPGSADVLEVQSRYYQLVENEPKALAALERAWKSGARNAGIGVRLARIYAKAGNSGKVDATFAEALDRFPTDTTLRLQIAKYLLRERTDKREAAAHLARAYNPGDRNYEARFIHAEYLYMQSDFDGAKRLFEEVDQLAPANFAPQRQPIRSDISRAIGRVDGRIVSKHNTYLFIQTVSSPDNLFAHEQQSRRDVWPTIKQGSNVSAEVVFTRKGPVAADVQLRR